MRFQLATLLAAQIPIAVSAEIGNETLDVTFTPEQFYNMGLIKVTGGGVADFVWSPQAGLDLSPLGRDFHLRCANEIVASDAGAVSVTLDVTYADDVTGTSTATIAVPAWATMQKNIFAAGAAADFVADLPADEGKLIKSIQSVNVVTNTLSGNKFEVIASPAAADFYEIGCATSKDGSFPVAQPVAIPCGNNAARWVKKGRSEVPSLSIGYKYISSMEDLNRVNGHRVGVHIHTLKDESVPFENRVFMGHLVSVSDPKGDSDDEVIATSEGPFENYMVFVAG